MSYQLAADPYLGIFVKGSFVALIIFLVYAILVYFFIQRARAGLPIPTIRKIAGLEALDEAIGRATEMGRPVNYVPGIGASYNMQTIASYAMLGHVAKRTAQYDTRFIFTCADPVVLPIAEEIIRQSYLEAGRPDAYNPDDVRFLSDWQFGYCSGVLGIYQRERPAANILFGAFWAESLIFAEEGNRTGSIQIGATANMHQIPFFVAACDYALIGEEMYAASAYLAKEPVLYGTVVSQDWMRIAFFAVIIIGTVFQIVQGKANVITSIFSK
ncbi:MAG: DUF6754 domain-containing protein [Bacillota bacterium]|nr:hypothetical protein [Bacillota bacterium]